MLLAFILLLFSYFTFTKAQNSTTYRTSYNTTTLAAASSSTTSLSTFPVTALFAPISLPLPLAGSVITTVANKTIFAIGCFPGCSMPKYLHVTVNNDTFTATDAGGNNAAGSSQPPVTVTCNLDIEHGFPAIAATCTSRSEISGLGTVASTSTLASTQISYAALTITAGAEKLLKAHRTGHGQEASSTSTTSGLAVKVTTAPVGLTAGAVAAGMAVLAAL